MKYYLIIDNGGWGFCNIVATKDEDDSVAVESLGLDLKINGPFIASICSRECHFPNRRFWTDSYYGWTISKIEYDRLKKLIDLYPKHVEYLKLLENP